MNQHSGIVGFRWHHHISVDARGNATGASGGTGSADSVTQSYGAWAQSSPPDDPPGGFDA